MDINMKRHEEMMRRAIALSAKAIAEPARFKPYGAIVVRDRDGEIIGEGTNNMLESKDPTAHAEIVAIRQACHAVDSFTLQGCTLYTSCEPCYMCSAVVRMTRLPRVFYGTLAADAMHPVHERLIAVPSVSEREYEKYQTSKALAEESVKIMRDWAMLMHNASEQTANNS